jgi:RHS repeat-associated protein
MPKSLAFTPVRTRSHQRLRIRASVCKSRRITLHHPSLRRYEYDAANRLANVTTGSGVDAPTTRYVHNALGQRLFKTEPQFAPVASGSNPTDPGVIQTLLNFFGSLWGGSTTPLAPSVSDKLGFQYYYDEDGSLLYEAGTGGAQSVGAAHYVYLPTPNGPMPIAFYNGSRHYAVQTDHLNTPRRLTQSDKKVAWQWAFSAFGDEQPTTGRNRFVDTTNSPSLGTTTIADVTFNLRYPGQYADKESGLSYNYFRSYSSDTGRYTQADPIDLRGGWNRFAYVGGNPLNFTDPLGLEPGIRVSGYKGFGGSYTRNGSVNIVQGGVGMGGGVVVIPNVQMPGSGGADATFGFGGGGNLTFGPASCSFNCSAGWEIYKDPATGKVSIKYFEDCRPPQINGRGQGGTGFNATVNLGVQGGYRSK